MRLTIIRMAILTVALIAAPHASADFEAGQSAWDAGNVEEALSQWRDGADAGDRRAMLELGRLYRQGLGVVQDYVEAHKWLNLAASQGEAAALEERDALAAQMTPEQVATAQQMAAAWQSGGSAQAEESSSTQDASQPPPQAIRAAQSLLTALGYQPGPADGVWTSSTEAAYQAFLRDAGLPQTDTLTPQAMRAIQSAAEQQGVAQTGDGTTIAGTVRMPAPPAANVPPPVSPDALHQAAQTGDIEVLKAVITAGVDVNARDSRGRTALMHTVNKGYPLLVSELLEAQADVNVRAPDGATALFMAAAHGHTEIVELLMKAGADVTIRGPQGKTPVGVAKTRYGERNAARQNGAPPAVLALLDGKTWMEAEEERAKNEQRVMKLLDEMGSIPAGKFRMGDRRGNDNEKPTRRVTVPAFKLSKHEVTFAQWDACVEDGGCNGYSPHDGVYADDDGSGKPYYGESWGRGDRAVVNVSWDDAQSFIDWLNDKTSGNYRLPTEAEWEYAARAGSKTKYSWGDDIGSNRANCDGCGSRWGGRQTALVGSFPANAWGLHDMHGNVEEWVQDCWNDSYKGAPTDGSAWTSGDCHQRVMRNGAWNARSTNVRSTSRHSHVRSNRVSDQGFRLAQDE